MCLQHVCSPPVVLAAMFMLVNRAMCVCCLSVVVLRSELMHVSDSTVRWCCGLCLPLHDLQCAFYLHVVSLGRKLCTHLYIACVCNFLQNEGL